MEPPPNQLSRGVLSQNRATTAMPKSKNGSGWPPASKPTLAPVSNGTSRMPHAPCSRGTTSARRLSFWAAFGWVVGSGILKAESGGPGQSRTADQRFRKPLLYPSELRGQGGRSSIFSHYLLDKFPGLAKPLPPAMGGSTLGFPHSATFWLVSPDTFLFRCLQTFLSERGAFWRFHLLR